MEIRRLLLCTAFLVLAVLSSCTEGRHSMRRRATDYDDYDTQNDGGTADEDTQNDGDGEDEDAEVSGIIVTRPRTYNITVGQKVRLECKISPENATGVVQWQRNGTMLFIGSMKAGASERFSIAPHSTDLLIANVQLNDTAEYECKLEQTNVKSIKHYMIVTEGFREGLSIISFTATDNGILTEGSDLLLTCEVAGIPPPQITWSRVPKGSDSNEKLTERDGTFTDNRVFIKNVQKETSGTYYCYARNSFGHKEASLTVTVMGKPRVHLPRTTVNSAVNISAILECSVHDENPVQIKWYKDGRLVTSSPILDISTLGSQSNLTVTPVSSEDFGNYTCEAENGFGKHSQSISLVQRPVITSLSVHALKLTWTIHSHQPLEAIEVQLINDKGEVRALEVNVPSDQKRVYQVTYILDEKQLSPGSYKAFVRVKNTVDWATTDEEVPVEIGGKEILNPEIGNVQEEPIRQASIFGGNSGHSIRPTTEAVISTILMYLLVRMF